MDKKFQFNLFYFFLALMAVMYIQDFWMRRTQVEEIPYSQFQVWLKEGKVSEIQIGQSSIQGVLKEPSANNKTRFYTYRVDPTLANQLQESSVKFSQRIESTFWKDVASWVIPSLLFFALWLFLMKRVSDKSGLGGGFMAIGKSKAKIFVETDTKTTFSDVAGIDEAEDELKEIVSFLKDPKNYSRLGGKMPKGVLLVGPPGCGKTLLAKALAGEAGVPFFSISGSEFVEMFVGVGAARVRDLFEQARKQAPCIVFIDELDALGRARSAGPLMGAHDEKEQTLNQLLVELDGFDSASGLVLVAATNRPEILDPALLRAGRFDRQILVDRPDKKGRIDILKVHLKRITTANDLKPEEVAALTPGFTGADLANLVNEAAIVATRRQADQVTLSDFTLAVERIIAGLEKKNRVLNPMERKTVAFHEMGHALVAASLPGADPIHKVSIIPRGVGALGYTIQRPTEDRYLMTREELEDKMTVLLGGRAAEKIYFDRISTGAADDISKVTDIARSVVMKYGMDPVIGNIQYDHESGGFLGPAAQGWQQRNFSDVTAREIDNSIKALVDRCFEKAKGILGRNKDVLESSANLLLEKETLVEVELQSFFIQVRDREHHPSHQTSVTVP